MSTTTDPTPEVEYRDLTPHGYPGYEAGDDGSVWSNRSGLRRRLKPFRPSPNARVQVVTLTVAGKNHALSLARLILTVFGPAEPEGAGSFDPWFRDCDRDNCAVANLEWQARARTPRKKYAAAGIAELGESASVLAGYRRAVQLRRATFDLTVAACAKRAGVTPDEWRAIEFGAGEIGIDDLFLACKVFDCLPSDLLPPGVPAS